VLTSAAVGGGDHGPPKLCEGGNREGALPPHRSCARSDQAVRLGTKEESKRIPLLLCFDHVSINCPSEQEMGKLLQLFVLSNTK